MIKNSINKLKYWKPKSPARSKILIAEKKADKKVKTFFIVSCLFFIFANANATFANNKNAPEDSSILESKSKSNNEENLNENSISATESTIENENPINNINSNEQIEVNLSDNTQASETESKPAIQNGQFSFEKKLSSFIPSDFKNIGSNLFNGDNLIYGTIGAGASIGLVSLYYYLGSSRKQPGPSKPVTPLTRNEILENLKRQEANNTLPVLTDENKEKAIKIIDNLNFQDAIITYEVDSNDSTIINVKFQLENENPITLRSLKINNLTKRFTNLCGIKNCDGKNCEISKNSTIHGNLFHGDLFYDRAFEMDRNVLSGYVPQIENFDEADVTTEISKVLPLQITIPYLPELSYTFPLYLLNSVYKTNIFPPYFWPEANVNKALNQKNYKSNYSQWLEFVEEIKKEYSFESFLESAIFIDFSLNDMKNNTINSKLNKIKDIQLISSSSIINKDNLKIQKFEGDKFFKYLEFMFFYKDLDFGRIPNWDIKIH